MNADGQFTLSDVWLWIVQVYFLPGDAVLWTLLTYTPGLATFLELGPRSYHGLFTAMVSGGCWLFVLVIAGVVYGLVRNLDHALTAVVVRYYREWRRRFRVFRTWTACQLRGLRLQLPMWRHEAAPDLDLGELELTEIDHEVLRSTALLAPGYVYTASDIAGSLDIRRGQARRTLDRLKSLHLLETGLSASDGETGYRLSESGRFLVMSNGGTAPA
jgi:hypothetical protein